MTAQIGQLDHLPAWVLEEPVDVTLVYENKMLDVGIYLMEHVSSIDCEDDGDHGRSAITVTIGDPNHRILLNGIDVDLGDDMIAITSLIDDANALYVPSDLDSQLPVGYTVHTEPFRDKE